MEFRDWLNEETREERAKREAEAEIRAKKTRDYSFDQAILKKPQMPEGIKFGSQEWASWMGQNRKRPPLSEYTDEVLDSVGKKCRSEYGKSLEDIFFADFDWETGASKPKLESDFERLHGIASDSFRDGTPAEKAVEMCMEFLKAQGYIG